MRYMGPKSGTKTRRREQRQRVRNILGSSSQRPPSLAAMVSATRALHDLMVTTSGGVYGVAIVSAHDPHAIPGPGELGESVEAWHEEF